MFRPTATLESLPPSVCCPKIVFKSVGELTEEETLRSALVVCLHIAELGIDREVSEEYWYNVALSLISSLFQYYPLVNLGRQN